MPEITEEQRAAIESAGRTIVSASAGSGKTFVMIKKLVAEIENGVDLDNVLAVTFTKKAAAQMREKLRLAIIDAIKTAGGEKRTRLKLQLSKVASASISTIHAFCARILRTYFYAADIDGAFDIVSADDSAAKELKNRALDNMFERYYEEDNADFLTLLRCFKKKRSDASLRPLVIGAYDKLRINAGYKELLDGVRQVYTEEGFVKICAEYKEYLNGRYEILKDAVINFAANFISPCAETYGKIFGEMIEAIDGAMSGGLFDPQPRLSVTRKPLDPAEGIEAGEKYKSFREELLKRYTALSDVGSEEEERAYFYASGVTAVAFSEILKDFDREYTAIKREENKLDYNDLEHLTLQLLSDESVRREINARYTCVFVDEYQDVNPVQEEIISRIGSEKLFLVGDVKQAIYGFRGSKSLFFAEKYNAYEGGDGSALRLSNNFRSSDGVLDFVNSLFSGIMTEKSCGISYLHGGVMLRGGGYPEGEGSARIHVYGEDAREERAVEEVYSVENDVRAAAHTREGLAVLEIVERELKNKHYDLKTGGLVDTQPGDICILTRKKSSAEVAGIVAALTDAGYSVSGAQDTNICKRPEVKEMLDILSYIDNPEQDIAMTTAMLSPLGNFSCDELARIRIAAAGDKGAPFRECCKKYAARMRDGIAGKLSVFYARTEELRDTADILCAAELIDVILGETGLEAEYASGGGEKLKSVRRLAAEAGELRLAAFLAELKDGGYEISAPSSASSDSIRVMTMHASKGLEFPVVIISDICSTFKGRDYEELPLNEKYGFAPKCHDSVNMLVHSTVLRRLTAAAAEREDIKNELNLFYVACTRAMCRLHIMTKETKPFSLLSAAYARNYSQLFDIDAYFPEIMGDFEDFKRGARQNTIIAEPDTELAARIEERFMKRYFAEESVNLPVKSSASALLKLNADDGYFRPKVLFAEGETGAERGTAYHRFLELCDFGIKDREGIAEELESFVSGGLLTAGQRNLLDADNLYEIINMPVFGGLGDAELYREREFLCRLPANELFETSAEDGVLVQGAIDLLAVRDREIYIIDYKYSKKSDGELIKDYSAQLGLYKKAVSLIMKRDPSEIRTAIVNIFARRQILL